MLLFVIFKSVIIVQFAQGHLPVKQPAFKNLPGTIKSIENETIFVPCLVENLGGSHVRWWKDDTLLYDFNNPVISTSKIKFLSDGITIDSLSAEDAGEYTCEVVRPEPWSSLKLIHMLQVMYAPKIFLTPPDGYMEVMLGDKVRIGCSATGVPPPVIAWRIKDAVIKSLEDNNEKLEFVASSHLMSGIYQCEANNGIGNPAHSNIILRILHKPEIKVERTWVHSAPGIKTALVCQVLAEPQSHVEWLFNGEILKSSTPRIMQQTRGDENVLLFNPIMASDFGNYTCKASNRLGTAKCLIQLSGVANSAVFKSAQGKPPNGFTLIWEVDSYSPIFEYKLLFRKENDQQWIGIIIPADSFPSGPLHSKSYTISGLDRHTLYEAKILSRNKFGWSDSSEIIKFSFIKPNFSEDETIKNTAWSPVSTSSSGTSRCVVTGTFLFAAVKLYLNIYNIF